jgi:hypothetical protein
MRTRSKRAEYRRFRVFMRDVTTLPSPDASYVEAIRDALIKARRIQQVGIPIAGGFLVSRKDWKDLK